MKNKELILLLSGIVLILAFAIWVFTHQKDMDKNNLIREDIYNDSIIKIEQDKLFVNDSFLKRKILNHEYRIKRLETK
jgi:hypothetical protein